MAYVDFFLAILDLHHPFFPVLLGWQESWLEFQVEHGKKLLMEYEAMANLLRDRAHRSIWRKFQFEENVNFDEIVNFDKNKNFDENIYFERWHFHQEMIKM